MKEIKAFNMIRSLKTVLVSSRVHTLRLRFQRPCAVEPTEDVFVINQHTLTQSFSPLDPFSCFQLLPNITKAEIFVKERLINIA